MSVLLHVDSAGDRRNAGRMDLDGEAGRMNCRVPLPCWFAGGVLALHGNANRLAAPRRLAFPLPALQIGRARMFFTWAADNGFGAMSRRDRFDSGD